MCLQLLENEKWLTLQEAATFLGVTVDSVRRYVRRDGLRVMLGRVRLSDLLVVERDARMRKGGRGVVATGRLADNQGRM